MDDEGITHYGETIPPEYADKDRSEMNKAGRVINVEIVLTPEELRAQREAKTRKREAAKAAFAQKRYDNTLTSTYSSPEEVDLARTRSLQHVDARINSANSQIKIAGDRLLYLQSESDNYSEAGKEIPDSLKDDLKRSRKRLGRAQLTMDHLQAERDSVDARYDADKARYKELTGKQSRQPGHLSGRTKTNPVISCSYNVSNRRPVAS